MKEKHYYVAYQGSTTNGHLAYGDIEIILTIEEIEPELSWATIESIKKVIVEQNKDIGLKNPLILNIVPLDTHNKDIIMSEN